MSTQTLAGHQFSTPCNRCGGASTEQLEHCPYCGAFHPLDDDASTRSALHESRPKTLNTLNMPTLHDSSPCRHSASPTSLAAHYMPD